MGNNNIHSEGLAKEIKGRGLFYAVIAVATFIIMAVGATFAYFTASTNSANSSVRAGSTTLRLQYISYEGGWMNRDLIPAGSTVVEYSFENQSDVTIKNTTDMNNGLCKDDDGNSICSVYVFQVKNEARSDQTVSFDVVSETNEFANLNAMAYEISLPVSLDDYNSTENNNGTTDPSFRKTSGEVGDTLINVIDADRQVLDLKTDDDLPTKTNVYSPIFVNRNGVVKTLLKYKDEEDPSVLVPAIDRALVNTVLPDGSLVVWQNAEDSTEERTTRVASDVTIGGGSVKTFALVLYIKDNGRDQTTTDAAKAFTGSVIVRSGDGTAGVSGTISMVTDETIKDLQSQQGTTNDEEDDNTDE